MSAAVVPTAYNCGRPGARPAVAERGRAGLAAPRLAPEPAAACRLAQAASLDDRGIFLGLGFLRLLELLPSVRKRSLWWPSRGTAGPRGCVSSTRRAGPSLLVSDILGNLRRTSCRRMRRAEGPGFAARRPGPARTAILLAQLPSCLVELSASRSCISIKSLIAAMP